MTTATTVTSLHPAGAAAPRAPLASRIQRGSALRSATVLVYGEDGVGKTSFGKGAPRPLFLTTETDRLPGELGWLAPAGWAEVLEVVRALAEDPLGYESVVLDTLDGIDALAAEYVCRRDNAAHKGALVLPDGRVSVGSYPFNGAGRVLLAEWRTLLDELERLRRRRGLNVVLLAHAGTYRQKNPDGADYDAVLPRLERSCAEEVVGWCEAVLYAEFGELVVARPDERTGKAKVLATEDRACWTRRGGAHRAKNRFGMPARVELAWREFARYALADTDSLRAELEARLAALGDAEVAASAREYVARHRGEAGAYFGALERLDKRIAEKASAAAT
jgi:hypothetical protein